MNINITIIGQAITFILLVLCTMKFIWPYLIKMLDERAEKIARGLADAELGKKQLADAVLIVQDELKKAQIHAVEIINNAEKRAEQIINLAKNEAIIQSNKIIEESNLQINQEVLHCKELLRSDMVKLIIDGVEKILQIEVNAKHHEQLLKQITAKL